MGTVNDVCAPAASDVWEPANRAILDARYPEYGPYTASHYDAPETIAERLLAALLPGADGRIDLAFDFSSFRAAHNGTYRVGRQMLAVRAPGDGIHPIDWIAQRVKPFAGSRIPDLDRSIGGEHALVDPRLGSRSQRYDPENMVRRGL